MTKIRNRIAKLTTLTTLFASALLAVGCASQSAESAIDAPGADHGLSKVVLLGDSVAAGQALPMTEAFAASEVKFQSLASDGGGSVVGPVAHLTWKDLPAQLASADPTLVIYQVTTYDWGSRQEQRAAYEKLRDAVAKVGAELAFVTMPPIKPDDFYRSHMTELRRTADVVRTVAESSGDQVHVLDASAVWGDTYQRVRDGKVDRSKDGIHTCPQGAARFTGWLLDELTKLYPGFTPASPEEWANAGWSGDKRFKGC